MSQLLFRSKAILKGLKENKSFFNDPPISLKDLETLVTQFEDLASEALNKSSLIIWERNDCADEVKAALKEIANYVQIKSKGNSTMILKAGMHIKKTGSYTRKEINKPYALEFKVGNLLMLHWKSDKNVMNYIEFSVSPDDEQSWRRYSFSSKRKIKIEGLESGHRYYFRVMSVTAGATSPFSPSVSWSL